MRIVLVIPAHNEEIGILDTLASVSTQTLQPGRVVVLCDDCTDNTATSAGAAGYEVWHTEHNTGKKGGALNQAWEKFNLQNGDYFATMEADTILHPDFFANAMERYARKSLTYGGKVGRCLRYLHHQAPGDGHQLGAGAVNTLVSAERSAARRVSPSAWPVALLHAYWSILEAALVFWHLVLSMAHHPAQRGVKLWRLLGLGVICFVALALFATLLRSHPPKPPTQRVIKWSGYHWLVRASGRGLPGPTNWSNSDKTVKVVGKELHLSMVKINGKWYSGQVQGIRSLGYGTYKWKILSDLSNLDPYDTLGMFVYDLTPGAPKSHNEIDIEAGRFGSLQSSNSSVSYWLTDSVSREFRFSFNSKPPYQAQFVWLKDRISFYISDAAGTPVVDVTFDESIPKPGDEVAMMNYWRFRGGPAPTTTRTIRLASFSFTPGR